MAATTKPSPIVKVLALVLPLLLAAAAYLAFSNPGANAGTTRLAALSQGLPAVAAAAVDGDAAAMQTLATHLGEIDAFSAAGALPGGAAVWDRLQSDARAILANGDNLTGTQLAHEDVAKRLPLVVAGSRELLIASGSVELVDDVEQAANILTEALAVPIGDATAAGTAALDTLAEIVAGLGGEASSFDITELTDPQFQAQLSALMADQQQLSASAATAFAGFEARATSRQILRSMRRGSQTLLPATAGERAQASALPALLVPGLLAAALLLSLILLVSYWRAARQAAHAAQQATQNDRNQQAILRLLDELGSLADGDLTVQATVTEDITGTIADSINYAIEALRDLVATINDTAIMVDSAAKQTEATARNMSLSASQQAHEVKSTTDELGAIIASIEEVSGNAERSSDVARHSVDVAHKGGDAVRRTIDGMNAIRETIQETSKRIKRLGESSQEIGNIVELINDIAEQTNILALNASIQASMAGEAGRGFAVVADEVQRLAERCTNATKQIEVLVRTIQADTNEAVVSMERSTTDVVGGALLAENAGAALDEIEQVSNQIASLVQNISSSAREQSSVAAHIDKRTDTLKSISDKTGRETAKTAAAISKLSELASQLRGTVAGFQLPDVGANSGVFTTDDSGVNASPERADKADAKLAASTAAGVQV